MSTQDDLKRELAAIAKASHYNIHPLANLFPLIKDDEFEDLCKDIEANGLLQPILHHNGSILDGRNRLRACKKLGAKPWFEEAKLVSCTATDLIWSLNIARRHLTPGQIAALKVQFEGDAVRAEGQKRHAAGVKRGGRGHKKNSSAKSAKSFDARKELASQAGVSPHQIALALRVQMARPELLPEVILGKMTLVDAFKQAGNTTRKRKPPRKAKRRRSRETIMLLHHVRDWREEISRRTTEKETSAQILAWLTMEFDRLWYREELCDWCERNISRGAILDPPVDKPDFIRMLDVLRKDDEGLPERVANELDDDFATYADAVQMIEKQLPKKRLKMA